MGKPVNFIALRLSRESSKITCRSSIVINVTLPVYRQDMESAIFKDMKNNWTGWEKNERGNYGPRLSNMKNSLDPKR